MPVQINQNSFEDIFGNVTPQYISNAGDEITATFEVRSQIRMTSVNNPLTKDPTLNLITSPTISWLEEGFRVGDWVIIRIYNTNGAVITGWYAKIIFVDDQDCEFNVPITSWYDIADDEFIVIYAVDDFDAPSTPSTEAPRERADLNLFINHSPNGQQGNKLSLIDGEATRVLFPNTAQMGVGSVLPGTFVSNQSGQFFKSAQLTRNNDTSTNFNTYTLELTFANSGVYNSDWFDTNDCLKFYMEGQWYSIVNDQYDPVEMKYDQDANTGFFDEPHNASQNNSSLVQGITEVDYCQPSTHTVKVDGPADVAIGACYISTDENYYKNKLDNQYKITMLVPSTDVSGTPTINSPQNSSGAGYTIEVTNVSTNGSETTVDFTFTPNADFNTFMENVDDGDRQFYIWIKCGNINHLVFAGQLYCDPPTGGPLTMTDSIGFLDHGENITELSGNRSPYTANTEDDLAYFGSFLLEKNEQVDSLKVKIEAYNTVTEEDFTLTESNFSFAGVQVSNDGRYLLNEVLNVITTLPSNSLKRDAKVYLYPSIDSGNDYGVAVYFPFLLNWKYWLPKGNVSTDFYPDQNENWEPYDDPANWEIRMELSVIKDGLAFTHTSKITDNPYDFEELIDSDIQLYRDSDNTNVQIVLEGELMRVVATHELNNGQWFDNNKIWGMITVEPTESSPRWICSTVLPFDGNTSNPLTPLDGVQMVLTYPSPNIARMECYFDPDNVNLQKGVKFTSKIKGCTKDPELQKTMTDGTVKTTTGGNDKLIAN